MTQIGEGIAIGTIKSSDEECFYCKEKPKSENLKNDEEADPQTDEREGEDDVLENDEKNDASKLGKNLGDKPTWTIQCPDSGEDTKVLSAAHHCIPGNASYKKVKAISKLVNKGGPFKLSGNIGYSINHGNNGVWLPGNYNVRVGKEKYNKSWGGYDSKFKHEYAKRAIKASNRQFHDAHTDYNTLVRESLTKLAQKMGKPSNKCPFCGEEKESTRPPYGLVGRLDFISRQFRNNLVSVMRDSRKRSHIGNGVCTSNKIKKFFRLEK